MRLSGGSFGSLASTGRTTLLVLIITCCMFCKTSGAPYAKRHFIGAQCNSDYWDQVEIAAKGTIDFDSINCNAEATIAGIIDGILADMPPPESGEKVALVTGFSSGSTGGVEHLARALLAGVHVFFIEDAPDLTPYGFDESKHMKLRFLPDNPQGARFTGQELCRIAGDSVQRVAVIYGANPELDLRIDTALEEFKKVCPLSRMDVAFKVRGDWSAGNASAIFETLFLVDSTLTTVLCANDGMALGVLEAADNVYTALNARALLVSGFDNSASIRPFLNSKRVFSTVDQLTIQPKLGMWNTIPKVMSVIESQGITTTSEIKMRLGLDTPLLKTDVGPVSADSEGYLIDTLDATYQATVRASPDSSITSKSSTTEVEVGLFDVRIQHIDSAEGSFDATLWLQLSWVDARLAWPVETYNGTLQRSAGSLWEPFVYLANIQSSEADSLISETSSTVSSDGRVTKAFKYMCTLGCNMNVQPFPFDIHPCFINVTVGSDAKFVTLKAMSSGMTVTDMPEAYEHELGPALEVLAAETPTGLLQAMVAFEFFIVHSADYEHTTFIMVAWALNMVSFGQFWISPNLGNMDRAGLAVTTILASTVLQADARSSKITTWLDVFFSLSIGFQFITFFMSVMTAHYVFDPDYESEDIMVEQLMETQREKLKSSSERDANLSPTSAGQQTKARKKQMKSLRYNLQNYLKFTDSVFGDERDIAPDRWGRRYVFPVFLAISAALPFFPRSGGMNIAIHPESGVHSSLFQICISFLVGWFGILISRFAVVAYLGENEDEREHFPESGGIGIQRQGDDTKVQFRGIDLEQSPPIATRPSDNVA